MAKQRNSKPRPDLRAQASRKEVGLTCVRWANQAFKSICCTGKQKSAAMKWMGMIQELVLFAARDNLAL